MTLVSLFFHVCMCVCVSLVVVHIFCFIDLVFFFRKLDPIFFCVYLFVYSSVYI